MDRSYVMKNTKSRERLHRLVNDISDSELKLVIYKEGWTIAAALAHLAFWDERRRSSSENGSKKAYHHRRMMSISIIMRCFRFYWRFPQEKPPTWLSSLPGRSMVNWRSSLPT